MGFSTTIFLCHSDRSGGIPFSLTLRPCLPAMPKAGKPLEGGEESIFIRDLLIQQ